MRASLFVLGLLLGASLIGRAARADDKPATEAATASKMAAEELKRWSIRSGDARGTPATPRPDPVLRYSNPGVGRVYGDVFLFIADGRPEAVMSIYKWFTPWTGFEAEMHSLSTSALKAERDGRIAWQPDGPGVRPEDLPEAPAPASSAVERLAQMRSMAGHFAGTLVDARVDQAGEDQALRLLTRPLYRFESRDPTLRDGALFAFVVGTDPEVFLLLEARETPRGPRWQYGLARMNRDPIRITYNGREVWRAPKLGRILDPHEAYWSMDLPQNPQSP